MNKEDEAARVGPSVPCVDGQELPQRGQLGEVTAAKLTHTAGPWSVGPFEGHVESKSAGRQVCSCMGYFDGQPATRLENQANAQLIAAAPDLLAAVKAIRLRLHFVGHPREPHVQGLLAPSVPDWRKEIALIEKALAKAEGQ